MEIMQGDGIGREIGFDMVFNADIIIEFGRFFTDEGSSPFNIDIGSFSKTSCSSFFDSARRLGSAGARRLFRHECGLSMSVRARYLETVGGGEKGYQFGG